MGKLRELDRREFLRRATLAGSAALVGGLAPGCLDPSSRTGRSSAAAGPGPAGPAPGGPLGTQSNPLSSPIDRIVVLMMENRSFDHYFGWRTGTHEQIYTGSYLDDSGNPTSSLHGRMMQTYSLTERHAHAEHHEEHDPAEEDGLHPADFRGCGHTDPDHGWNGGRDQMEHGFLTGRNDELAIGYYLPEDRPFHTGLADRFTLCDNYFTSILAPTFPNREYMHSAQSGGIKSNDLPLLDRPEYPTGFTWPTIWDLLEERGVSWAYYFVDLPAVALWGAKNASGARHIESFFTDAYSGNLPNVAFVDPMFTTGLRTDEHPYSDMRTGEAFMHNIVKAIVESPTWSRTALFINYDEWGGFFDHVRPPRAPDVRGTDDDPAGAEDFGQLGFRVPCTVVSPYARRGRLASEILRPAFPELPGEEILTGHAYEHTSILKFIEWRFGLPALTVRDEMARNIGELLDFEQEPIDAAEAADGLVSSVFRLPVASYPCKGQELEGLFLPEGARGLPHGLYPDPLYDGINEILDPSGRAAIEAAYSRRSTDVFQRALDSGLFERFGLRTELRDWRYVFGG